MFANVLVQTFPAGGLVQLLITLLVVAVIVYVVSLILGMLNLSPTLSKIAYLILAVIVIIWLLAQFGVRV